jgi:hypothetical protein
MNKHRRIKPQFHVRWNWTIYKCEWSTWSSGRIITHESASHWLGNRPYFKEWDVTLKFEVLGGECNCHILADIYLRYGERYSGRKISPKMEAVGSYKCWKISTIRLTLSILHLLIRQKLCCYLCNLIQWMPAEKYQNNKLQRKSSWVSIGYGTYRILNRRSMHSFITTVGLYLHTVRRPDTSQPHS